MSGPSRRIRLTLPVSVTTEKVLAVTRRQDNRLYLRGEVFWSPNVYAHGDLLSVLRGYGFGVPADAANAHGQAVSTVQLVGMAEGFSNSVLLYSAVDVKTQVLAASKSPSVVKMELSEDLSANGTPETADAITARGQLVSALQAIAMPSKDLVFGYGQTLGEFKVQLLATDPADAEEAFGCVRGYLVGSLNPGSDAGLAIMLTSVDESVGALFGESQEPEPVLMTSENQMTAIASAIAAKTCTVTFMADGEIVHQETVLEGDSCPDPVASGVIEIPATGSSDGYIYVHSGWSLTEGGSASSDVLNVISDDTVVYAAFLKSYSIEGSFTMDSGPQHVSSTNDSYTQVAYPGGEIPGYLNYPASLDDLEVSFHIGDRMKAASKISVSSTIVYSSSKASEYSGWDRLWVWYFDVNKNRIGKYTSISISSYAKLPAGDAVTRTRTGVLTPPENAEYMVFGHHLEGMNGKATITSAKLTLTIND